MNSLHTKASNSFHVELGCMYCWAGTSSKLSSSHIKASGDVLMSWAACTAGQEGLKDTCLLGCLHWG